MTQQQQDRTVERVRKLRLERDLTYDQMARLIGIHAATLYRFLNLDGYQLNDRTQYKVDQWLAQQRKKRAA